MWFFFNGSNQSTQSVFDNFSGFSKHLSQMNWKKMGTYIMQAKVPYENLILEMRPNQAN